MEFYHIVPPECLSAVEVLHPLSRMMVLGQKLVSDFDYRERCRAMSRKGTRIIVDNGAAEHDQPAFREIAKAAEYIEASEVVLPDVLYDADQTLTNLLNRRNYALVPPKQRVVIPQGRTVEEWGNCYWILRQKISFGVLGVPKLLEQFPGGRPSALDRVWADPAYSVHLFGIWSNPYREITQALKVSKRIRSIDSGAAVAYAQAKVPLDSHTEKHASLQWTSGGLWNGQAAQVVANMVQLELWCNPHDK